MLRRAKPSNASNRLRLARWNMFKHESAARRADEAHYVLNEKLSHISVCVCMYDVNDTYRYVDTSAMHTQNI